MKNKQKLVEAFMTVWEEGFRIKSTVLYEEIPSDYLESIGWDVDVVPIEADDIEFIAQYGAFLKVFC